MDERTVTQIAVGALFVVCGVLAWVLPYRWNPFRLRRSLGALFSEKTNMVIAKVLGTMGALLGLGVLIATLKGVRFQ